MKKEYLQIIEYEKQFSEISASQFSNSEEVTRENVKDVLLKRSSFAREIITKTNKIIDEHVSPFLNNPSTINEKEELELTEFCEVLSNYRQNIDTGLCAQIRNVLAELALQNGNEELYIKHKFFEGLALFHLDVGLFRKQRNDCYKQIIDYSYKYTQFSEETRNLIVRAYGNYYICEPNMDIDEIYKRFDLARDFWNNTAKKHDKHFNWYAFEINLNENICISTLTVLRSDYLHTVKKEHLSALHKSAVHLYKIFLSDKKFTSNDYTSAEIKYIYQLYSAEYYLGYISLNDMLTFLYNLFKSAKDGYVQDDLYKKCHIGSLYLYYIDLYKPKNKAQMKWKKQQVDKLVNNVSQYIMKMPEDYANAHITGYIRNFAATSFNVVDDTRYFALLLSLTIYRHAPTYAHSVMVAKIAHVITAHIAKHCPKKFIGMPGITCEQDVKTQLSDILFFVWISGLIHDIGKIVYSHIVSFYVRRLNDLEFKIIKNHSVSAHEFIRDKPSLSSEGMAFNYRHKLNDNSDLLYYFSDIAKGHHKSYDGKFGYPEEFDNLKSPVKFIIDIITIADSIDAATDSVGRNYAAEKTLETLKDDVLSQTGTRYSPYVANEVFNNKELYDKINDILKNFRYDVYYSCFDKSKADTYLMPPH